MTKFYKLKVSSITRETAGAVSIGLDVPERYAAKFHYLPGQYLTLRATVDGEDIRRAYSICSAPYEPILRVGIKQVEGGAFSHFANNTLKVGSFLEVMPPQGRFTPLDETSDSKHYLGVAAGSGITPVLSILKTVLALDSETRFTLLYGNQTSQSVMFAEEIEDLKNIYLDRLTVVHILSREMQDVPLLSGRINHEKLMALSGRVVSPADITEAFLCGPADMVRDIRQSLVALGIAPDKIQSELFASAAPRKQHKLTVSDVAKAAVRSRITVTYDGKRHAFDLLETDDSILDAAARNGIELPYSCKGGMCCTCRCNVDAGSAEMTVNYSLEPWELQAGFVLGCQVQPLTPELALDFDQV
ncbi:MAG: 1,2-phenylacetyl-CoA epoxidase subunit PaaE [Beijerinckiaceae bacterium]